MNSSQLDLWEDEVAVLPWRGQSPRGLTRVGMGLFLRREPQKGDCFLVGPDQIDMFLEAITGPRRCGGAPSLYEHLLEGG